MYGLFRGEDESFHFWIDKVFCVRKKKKVFFFPLLCNVEYIKHAHIVYSGTTVVCGTLSRFYLHRYCVYVLLLLNPWVSISVRFPT
jgi:hypothetical protein